MKPMDKADKIIVLVEDDPIITAALTERLSEAGYSVTAFATADEALQDLDKLGPELIITDVRLPGMDGIDFLKQLKQRDRSISVIVMTGYATVSDAVAAAFKVSKGKKTSTAKLAVKANDLRIESGGADNKSTVAGYIKVVLQSMEAVGAAKRSGKNVTIMKK